MIYQYVKRYLKHTIIKPNVDFKWTPLINIDFFAYIEKRYTYEEFSKEISEVKTAFRDFFEPAGNLIFRYKEDSGIKIKIFPYRVEPKDSKHLKDIIKIIHHNRKYIKYPYQDQNDQIAILGKIRRDINQEISDTTESVNSKELIKYAIRVALELNDEDIITQLKRMYIIKIFNKNSVLEVEEELAPPTKREGIANRFNGYTSEQIQGTYKEIFGRDNLMIDKFLKDVMTNLFSTDLNFKIIDNKFYENNSLKIIHAAIAKELTNYIELEQDYILGITGYLMRLNFYKIHELMAMEIIKCIHDKNMNAKDFLLYYNGKTVVIKNEKHIIPSLETEDGRQWNNSSLIGICNLWMNTKKKKEVYEKKLLETDIKLESLAEKLSYIQPEKELQEKIIVDAQKKAEIIDKANSELEKKLHYLENTSLNSNEYFALQEEVKISQSKVMELKTIIQNAKKNLNTIKDANITTYTELEFFKNQKKELLNDVKAQDSNINLKSAQIDPIIESIVKVLMARTTIVEN